MGTVTHAVKDVLDPVLFSTFFCTVLNDFIAWKPLNSVAIAMISIDFLYATLFHQIVGDDLVLYMMRVYPKNLTI